MNTIIILLLSALIGYLLGSLPIGYIIGKLHGHDLTKEGSGSTGTTNVLRIVGKVPAIIVLIGDFFKGVFAPIVSVFIISLLIKNNIVQDINYKALIAVTGAFFCLLGHVKSCWIGFKGGKAVASGVGTLFGLNWIVGLAVALIWIITVALSKYSSLGALIAMPLSPTIMYLARNFSIYSLESYGKVDDYVYNIYKTDTTILIGYCAIGALYIVFKHKANIKRLLTGTEPKVGKK